MRTGVGSVLTAYLLFLLLYTCTILGLQGYGLLLVVWRLELVQGRLCMLDCLGKGHSKQPTRPPQVLKYQALFSSMVGLGNLLATVKYTRRPFQCFLTACGPCVSGYKSG